MKVRPPRRRDDETTRFCLRCERFLRIGAVPGDSFSTRPRTYQIKRCKGAKAIIIVAMATIVSGCWMQYRGNLAHSGNQSFEFAINAANVSTLTESWKGTTAGAITTAPAVAGGRVYVRGRDRLLAFDAAGLNGCAAVTPKVCSPIWRADSLGDVMSSPTVAAGTVLTAAGDGLRAFDATASGP